MNKRPPTALSHTYIEHQSPSHDNRYPFCCVLCDHMPFVLMVGLQTPRHHHYDARVIRSIGSLDPTVSVNATFPV
jgi:hypothetical protein